MRGIISIPPDGRWHRVPGYKGEAPATPYLQLDFDAAGMLARNTGSVPLDVRYEEECDAPGE